MRDHHDLRLRRAVLLTMLAAALGLSLLAPPAAAHHVATGDSCVGDPQFCVTYGVDISSLNAGAPLDATVTVANSSPAHNSNKVVWADELRIELPKGSGVLSTASATRSSQLPDGLVVMGGGACSAATHTSCEGGFGTVYVDIDGTTVEDGIHTGRVALLRMTNVNPPAAGMYLDYEAVLDLCIDSTLFGACFVGTQVTVPVQVEEPAAGVPVLPHLTLPVHFAGQEDFNSVQVTYDAAVDSLTLNLDGNANTRWDDTLSTPAEVAADKSYRVFTMPKRCGLVSMALHVKQNLEDSYNLTIPKTATIANCPGAAFTAKPDGFVGMFNGAASSSPLAGRTIKSWHWDFGDGTKKVTTSAQASRRYSTYGHHTVKLFVTDSAGAISPTISKTLLGTITTISGTKGAERVRVYGQVTPKHAGKKVTIILQRRRDGAYRNVETKTRILDADSRYEALFDRAKAGACKLVTTFPGDADHLGSKRSATFEC